MSDKVHLLNVESDEDEGGLGFGEDKIPAHQLRKPIIALFHILFKSLAIVVYVFSGIFGNGFVASFVSVVILLALDFWTVKNITGRLLVGMRWWNNIDDQGQSQWIFESKKGFKGRGAERRVFWMGLIVPQVIWTVFLFWTTFTFRIQWTILVLLAIVLNGANLYGYIRCSLGHNPGISDATGFLGQGLTNMIIQRAASTVIGGQGSSSSSGQNQATNAFTQEV